MVPGWEQHKLPSKVYDLSQKDREHIDQTFDELHKQGRMSWSKHPTPFGFPVFVVWRAVQVDGQTHRKGRAVVDIRGLNFITVRDTYPLPLQGEIILSVRGCYYITIVDAASFFYQWLVAMRDRYKLTVISHRGQEYFNVAPMGFKNCPPYVQRQMDRILRDFRAFCRTYIDDIVIFSVTLEDHIKHLSAVFSKFQELGITLSPKKAFIGYPSVTLLGEKVDGLGLSTDARKSRLYNRSNFHHLSKTSRLI